MKNQMKEEVKKIIANAKMAAYKDGYEQTVYLDDVGEPCYCRKNTSNLSDCKIVGHINIFYKNGCQHRVFKGI